MTSANEPCPLCGHYAASCLVPGAASSAASTAGSHEPESGATQDAPETRVVYDALERPCILCPKCLLIFVDPSHHLSPEAERARYETHLNRIEDQGYVDFLNLLLEPAMRHVGPGMRGLDYGCGPGPVMSRLAGFKGLECEDYDPLFFSRPPTPPYDFILSSECFEHFRKPADEIEKVCGLLRRGGILGVMTEWWNENTNFGRWHYARDATHLSFYNQTTMDRLCEIFKLTLLWRDERRVAIFKKD